MKRIFPLFLVILFLTPAALMPSTAHAGECYEDPEIPRNWSATVTTGANVRNGQCMDGTTVVTTAHVGSTVTVIGEVHGWYHIRLTDGTTGWVGQWLLAINGEAGEEVTYEEPKEEPKIEHKKEDNSHETDSALSSRLKGHILLQVEDLGKAWYVNPADGSRYYMKDGSTAYEMMRAFGLGINENDFAALDSWDYAMRARLAGQIVLRVEKHGEAYWIHPDDLSVNYLKDGDAAYSLMRLKSLGITNTDLEKISSRTFNAVPYDKEKETVTNEKEETNEVESTDAQVSDLQAGTVPSNIDLIALNEYWLSEINDLRAERGLRQLNIDQRWIDTATEYAQYMYKNQAYAHERDGGLSMHDWIDTKGLDFTQRYSQDGWNENYFTENISWGITDNSQSGVEAVLDYSKDFFLGEIDWNGPHYRTIYHEDWNSVGVGFYFEALESGSYKVYIVMHYGSLAR